MVKLNKFAQNCQDLVLRRASRLRTAVRRVLSRAQVHPVNHDERPRNEAMDPEQIATILPARSSPQALLTVIDTGEAYSKVATEFEGENGLQRSQLDCGYLEEFSGTTSRASSIGSSLACMWSSSSLGSSCSWGQLAPEDTDSSVSSLSVSSRGSTPDSLEYTTYTEEQEDSLYGGVSTLTRLQSSHPSSLLRRKMTAVCRELNHVNQYTEQSTKRRRPLSPVGQRRAPPQFLEVLRPETLLPGAIPDYSTRSPSLCY